MKLSLNKLFFLFFLTTAVGAETVSVPPPSQSATGAAVPADAVSPGKDLKDLGGVVPATAKKSECKDLSITPNKLQQFTKEAKTVTLTVNKPFCVKGVLTSESWVSIIKDETEILISVEENNSESIRSTEIVFAGIDKGVSIDISQSNVPAPAPVPKKETLKENIKKPIAPSKNL